MKEYNKENLIFLAVVGLAGLTTFFTIVACTYVGKGWWAMPLPLAAIGYGIYSFIKKYLPKQ